MKISENALCSDPFLSGLHTQKTGYALDCLVNGFYFEQSVTLCC